LLTLVNKLLKEPDNFSKSFANLIKNLLEIKYKLANGSANKFVSEVKKIIQNKNNNIYNNFVNDIDTIDPRSGHKINCEHYFVF
jgi:hypothetical protein